MSKQCVLPLMVLCASLWAGRLCAQESVGRVLTIDELFLLADENSKSIRISETTVKQAGQAVKVARQSQLPSVDISLSVSYLGDGWIADRDFTNGVNAPMPHYGNNFSVEASQVIYAGGAISANIASAELQQQIAALAMENNRQKIRFLLLGHYLDLYKLQNQKLVYEKNIEQTELLLKHISARHREGTALQNDITRYELQLQNLKLSLTELNNTVRIVNHELVSTLGLPGGTFILPDTTILSHQLTPETEDNWQERALTSNPHLRMAELEIDLSRQQEKITRSGRLPKVALVAANKLDGPIVIEVPPINKNFNYWYVGVGVQFDLASLYKTGRKLTLSKQATLKARQSHELALEETEIAVQAAWVRMQEAFEKLRTQEKSVELAVENYEVVNNRYLNDLALLTDMIDAFNSRLSAELTLVNARINIIYNHYKLQYVAGTL